MSTATPGTAPSASRTAGRGIGAVLREIGRTLLGALAVVLEAVRLLVSHWPMLMAVLLLGAIGRELALWGSFELSKVSPVAATVTVALAPLASVVALVVALRILMPSMEHVPDDGRLPRSQQLAVVGSALVPFLAVYAAEGYLRKDARRFVNETFIDEHRSTNWFAPGAELDDRTWAGAPLVVVIAVVVIALVLRWGLDRFELPQRHWGFGFLAGWVEALWLLTIATTISTNWGNLWAWALDRRGVHWMTEAYQWLVGALGPIGSGFDTAVSWLWGLLGNFDALVVVPLAWLTVGAVVYGRELAAPAEGPDLDKVGGRVVGSVVGSIEDERARARLERIRRRAELAAERAERMRQRTSVLPAWLRSWFTSPITSVTGRFSRLGKGLLTLVRAGLVPMVTLCLVLIAGRHAGSLLADLVRWVVGPMDPEWGITISPIFDNGLTMVNTLLMVVLIAAAVDRFLSVSAQEVEAEHPEDDPRPSDA